MRTACLAISLALAPVAIAQTPSWRLINDLIFAGPIPPNPYSEGHGIAYDSVRRVTVLAGGYYSVPPTWTWDGRAWTRYNNAGLEFRYHPAMAFDSRRGLAVLYGGRYNSIVTSETWEWNGQAWTLRPVAGPGPREYHGMAYDSDRAVVVLHGGGVNDTWEFDGDTWAQRSPTGPTGTGTPYERVAMAYDTVRRTTLLVDPQQTWAWNGSVWTVLAPSPTALPQLSLAFDTHRGIAVLFASEYFGGRGSGTFGWNGAAWTQTASGAPYGRPMNGLSYDSDRQRVVLTGGYCPGCDTPGTNETWEYGLICPADCDGISHPPVLTIADFACFMNKFAAATEIDWGPQYYIYANCDGSTTDPALTVADFACFLNAYAAGCP